MLVTELPGGGCALDAGAFHMELKTNPAEYNKWILAHPANWEAPPRQPVDRCVHQLLSVMLRTIKTSVAKTDVSRETKLTLDKKEVLAFIRKMGGGEKKR